METSLGSDGVVEVPWLVRGHAGEEQRNDGILDVKVSERWRLSAQYISVGTDRSTHE